MMSIRVDLHPGYILHTRAYRDTSLLVDALTHTFGKISVVAKGVRKSGRHQRYLLQPFIPVLLSWQGKSTLKTLVGIEAAEESTNTVTPVNLNGGLSGHKLYSAMYINELLAYLLPQYAPCTDIFDHYQQLLNQFMYDDVAIEPCLRHFELMLLDELGCGINFYHDADSGHDLEADQYYIFFQHHGFVAAKSNPEDNRGGYFLGKTLLNIHHRDFSEKTTCQAAKVLVRIALRPHLRGRELKSRELFTPLSPPPTE